MKKKKKKLCVLPSPNAAEWPAEMSSERGRVLSHVQKSLSFLHKTDRPNGLPICIFVFVG